ncbi:MAG: hypothetical protein H8K04_08795 [Nitrospira sp.]
MKPVLYLDVDGVLFGLYGTPEAFQLRPGVTSFLTWIHERFQLSWLTAWSQRSVEHLCDSIYFREVNQTRYVNWSGYAGKELWLAERKDTLAKVDWLWIDDNLPVPERLRELGLDPARCLPAAPTGADELQRLQGLLQDHLSLPQSDS